MKLLLNSLLAVLFSTSTLLGQGLITLLPTNTQYTNAQLQDIQKISTWQFKEDYRLVELGSFASNEQDGFLSFSIPGMETASFLGQVELVENDNDTSYFWSGSIVGEPGGYFCFGRNTQSAGGYIKFTDRFYTLYPIGGTKCLMVKHNLEGYVPDVCTANEGTPTGIEVDECDEEYNTCAATIDILYLITPEARAFLNGFDFWGLLIFSGMANASINQAFQNSDIPNKQVRIRGSQNFVLGAGYSDPHDIDIDTDNLVNDATAQALRNQFRADIVVMLTNQGYFNGPFQIFGNASQINADNDHAYCIVEIPFMIAPRWTFPHEVGHLFGARHNTPDNGGNDDTDVCAHGWRFDDGDEIERRTILAALGDADPNPFAGDGRILHYSNPDVQFNDGDTGTEDDNNARAIRNTGCNIASFRSSPLLSVFINGPGLFCVGEGTEPQTYMAQVTPAATGMPGQPPYTYQWHWSPNANFSPYYIIGNTQSITINSVLACPHFYLRAKVTGSGNTSVTHTRWIRTHMCEECNGSQNLVVSKNETNVDATSLSKKASPLVEQVYYSPVVYPNHPTNHSPMASEFDAQIHPNPSSGTPKLSIALADEADVVVNISSSNGVEVKNIQFSNLTGGLHTVGLDLGELPPGIYLCEILAGKSSKTLKLVLTK